MQGIYAFLAMQKTANVFTRGLGAVTGAVKKAPGAAVGWAGKNPAKAVGALTAVPALGLGAAWLNAPKDYVEDMRVAKQNIDSLNSGNRESWNLFRNTFGGILNGGMSDVQKQQRLKAWQDKYNAARIAVQQGHQHIGGQNIVNPFGVGTYNDQNQLAEAFKGVTGQTLRVRPQGQVRDYEREQIQNAMNGASGGYGGYGGYASGTGAGINL